MCDPEGPRWEPGFSDLTWQVGPGLRTQISQDPFPAQAQSWENPNPRASCPRSTTEGDSKERGTPVAPEGHSPPGPSLTWTRTARPHPRLDPLPGDPSQQADQVLLTAVPSLSEPGAPET